MINSRKKGFTLVELVIVIAVVVILAAVLIPTFSSLVRKANESSDIQAVRNMNTFLVTADITDGVDSILDVYEVFEESDYVVENYKPLYKGRYFYYDKQKNQILYVGEDDKVLFPTDSKEATQGNNDWFSLSLEIKLEEIKPTVSADTITYTVSTPQQYAYVVDQLNKDSGEGKNIVININEDLDFMGACITINSVDKNSTITINGGNHELKNITSVESTFVSDQNSDKVNKVYGTSAIFGCVNGTIIIKELTLKNINIKNEEAGTVGILATYMDGNATLTDISISNSTVIGNRSVGALYGQTQGVTSITGVELSNIDVKTVAGRSGKYIGHTQYSNNTGTIIYGKMTEAELTAELAKIVETNVTLSMYECELNTGSGLGYNNGKITSIEYVDGKPTNKVRNHNENAYLYWIANSGEKAITLLTK